MEGLPAEVVNRRGLYDVTLYRVVHDRSLRQETIFECVLSIPSTQYQITRRLIYYPGSSFNLIFTLIILFLDPFFSFSKILFFILFYNLKKIILSPLPNCFITYQ